MAAAVSERVTITSSASCLCMFPKLVSAQSYIKKKKKLNICMHFQTRRKKNNTMDMLLPSSSAAKLLPGGVSNIWGLYLQFPQATLEQNPHCDNMTHSQPKKNKIEMCYARYHYN